MDEKLIERKLVRLARQSGGLALKFTSPGFAGVPDRLLLFPGGKAAFAEIKTTGKKPRSLQMSRKNSLRISDSRFLLSIIRSRLEVYWMKYSPHEYQAFATNFIISHPISAIFLDCGLGKTVITLTAIDELMYNSFEVSRVLVIGPLRV